MRIRILRDKDPYNKSIFDCQYHSDNFPIEVDSVFILENKEYAVLRLERVLDYDRHFKEISFNTLDIYVKEIG